MEREGKKEYLSVCEGYANILINVLACLEIKAEFVCSITDKVGNSDGHAWNLVILDGQKYYCDLTWDQPDIETDFYPLSYFLCSHADFLKSHKEVGFNDNMADKEANISLSSSEQYELFLEVLKNEIEDELEEMKNEEYLNDFISQYLDSLKRCEDFPKILEFFCVEQNKYHRKYYFKKE